LFAEFAASFSASLSGFVYGQVTLFETRIEWIVLWMAAAMVFFTFYLGFINIRGFLLSLQILGGRHADPDAEGEISPLRALATAVSGTVGLGNIAGVAIAIAAGGPGATFWMIVIAFFSMSLKFAEATMGVKYRVRLEDGSIFGGPMYYLKAGLAERGWPRLGVFLATTYALFAIPNMMQVAQINQSYSQLSAVTGYHFPWLFGISFALLAGVVIVGGIRSIAAVTSRLVPLMCGIYLSAAITILALSFREIPAAFAVIFEGAFRPEGVAGGILGVFVVGMRRATYSTEAGLGSSSMAHAAAKTNQPVSEGLVALIEPFIDTIVVSTMTALIIVITGAYRIEGFNDIQMTSAAFGSVVSWFPYVLALCVLLFAFTTIISWGYYMSRSWSYLFGYSSKSLRVYQVLFCLGLVPGAAFTVQQAFDIIDSFFILLALPNLIGLYLMAPMIKKDMREYLHQVRSVRPAGSSGTS
jgi:AGCS family alanine or glycine:cation symporter